MEKLQVELGSVVSGLDVSLELPTIIQTSGLPQDDALAFVKDCADGKRKIAKAVRNKYETITNKESGITEYSTFEELSNKISQIPVEVPLGSAMEQNGGVLPFYDVYNETLKAMKEFAGYGFNGCCAFELDKWSYDDDHKVTLSGADAYYTSDGTFIKDNIIYKNGSQIGELDNSLYQFQDQDAENTNRFVVYFFVNERYQVPKTLHATSCLNLWCVKGTPLMNFNADFTSLNSINVYDGELEANSASDVKFTSVPNINKLVLCHIKTSNVPNLLFALSNLTTLCLSNLEESNETYLCSQLNKIKTIKFPKLITAKKNYIIEGCKYLESISMPILKNIKDVPAGFISNQNIIKKLDFPCLENVEGTRLLSSVTVETLRFQALKILATSSNFIQSSTISKLVSFDVLEEIPQKNVPIFFIASVKHLHLPKLHTNIYGMFGGSSTFELITLGNPVGGSIKIMGGTSSTTKNECSIVIEKGFKSSLNMGYVGGLTQESIYNIIDNLAVCEGDDKDKYTITLSKSVATTEMESAIVAKGYLFATLG